MRKRQKAGSLVLALLMIISGIPVGVMPTAIAGSTPPTDPTVIASPSHTAGGWSNETTISIEWIGGNDSSSGVAGYSFSWTKDATALPDTTIDTAPIDFNRPTVAAGGSSGGTGYTVALKSDGTAAGVGSGGAGQTAVSSWSDITAVAAGNSHTLGLKTDGTVAAVGSNGLGQTTGTAAWTDITAVAAGQWHSLGLKSDGTVVAVGANDYGMSAGTASWTDIAAVAAGRYHTVGLKSNGTAVAVGFNPDGRTNVSSWTDITAVAAGFGHTVGLKSNGTVVAVGESGNGETNVSTWTGIIAIAAGARHTVGLKSDGTLVATGANDVGQTDVAGLANIRQPTYATSFAAPVMGDWWFNLRTVDRNGNWTSTVHRGPFRIEGATPVDPAVTGSNPTTDTWTNDNTIQVNFSGAADSSSGVDGYSIEWSDSSATVPDAVKDLEEATSTVSPPQPDGNRYFHLRTVDNAGNWTSTVHYGPFKIETAAPADPAIVSSPSHTAGAWSNETTIGMNWIGGADTSSGVAGYSYSWTKDATAQPDAGIDINSTDFRRPTIAAGDEHTVGLKSDGTVVAVGLDSSGQVSGTASWTDIKAIAAGGWHTVGLKSDGTVVAVGLDSSGQVSGTASWTDIKAIAAGWRHTVGLKSDGTVVAVGNNDYGQTTGTASWTDIVAIAAGLGHTVGLKPDGTAVAIGLNEGPGQIDVGSWTDIVAIAAGHFHTLGLKSDGTVVAKGFGLYGQTDLSTWKDIVAIAGGFRHTVGLKSDGTVLTKGDDTFGSIDVSGWSDIVAVAAGQFHTVGLKSDGAMVAVGNGGSGRTDVASWSDIRSTAAYQVPSDGAWYFNLRTKDRAGNWTSTVHRGPYLVDTAAPGDAAVTGSTPAAGVWTRDNTILVNFAGATDNLSGVDGFSIEWSGSPTTVPDTVKDLEESAASALSPPQPDGDRYFHLRTRDNSGNWASTIHYGPFKTDTTKPTASVRAPRSVIASGATARFRISWRGMDGGSGVKNYDVKYKIGKWGKWRRWKRRVTALRGRFTGAAGKTYFFRARTKDKAGNVGAWSRPKRTVVN